MFPIPDEILKPFNAVMEQKSIPPLSALSKI